MWIYIKNRSYNMDHFSQVSSEITVTSKTYLSMRDSRGVETRIQLGLDEIEKILRNINDIVIGE